MNDVANVFERPRRYEVRLGHAKVEVQGSTLRNVLDEARRRLCLEMPRLWDLIRSATDDQFEVREVA